MRIDRPLHRVHPLVGRRVRAGRSSEEREPHRLALDGVAVLAVVDERDPVPELGHVGELMGADFEAGNVPAEEEKDDMGGRQVWMVRRGKETGDGPGVPVSGSLDGTELGLVPAKRRRLHSMISVPLPRLARNPPIPGSLTWLRWR